MSDIAGLVGWDAAGEAFSPIGVDRTAQAPLPGFVSLAHVAAVDSREPRSRVEQLRALVDAGFITEQDASNLLGEGQR